MVGSYVKQCFRVILLWSMTRSLKITWRACSDRVCWAHYSHGFWWVDIGGDWELIFLTSSQIMLMLFFRIPYFEKHYSMVRIKFCLASLEEPWMKSNHILLFQMEKLKAYVDAVFFPRACWKHSWYFECSSYLDLHPITEDWFTKLLRLLGSLLGSWCAAVCTGGVAGFIQTSVYSKPSGYFSQCVSSQNWEWSSVSVCQTLALWTKSCNLPGFSVSPLKNEISITFSDSNISGKVWH